MKSITVCKYIGKKCDSCSTLSDNLHFQEVVALYLRKLSSPGKFTKYSIRQWEAGEVIKSHVLTRD